MNSKKAKKIIRGYQKDFNAILDKINSLNVQVPPKKPEVNENNKLVVVGICFLRHFLLLFVVDKYFPKQLRPKKSLKIRRVSYF
jgi:hypothetical protein